MSTNVSIINGQTDRLASPYSKSGNCTSNTEVKEHLAQQWCTLGQNVVSQTLSNF
jgi:hypothetical protein